MHRWSAISNRIRQLFPVLSCGRDRLVQIKLTKRRVLLLRNGLRFELVHFGLTCKTDAFVENGLASPPAVSGHSGKRILMNVNVKTLTLIWGISISFGSFGSNIGLCYVSRSGSLYEFCSRCAKALQMKNIDENSNFLCKRNEYADFQII